MNWQTVILAHTLLVSVSVLALRAIAKQKYAANASFVINASQHIFQFGVALCLIPFLGAIDISAFRHYYLWLIGGGLIFTLANVCTYKLLSYLDAGISSVLSTLNVLSTILFAGLILHEDLNSSQAIGAVLLLIAVGYITLIARKHSRHHSVRNPWLWGVIFAILSAIFLGLALVNEKFLLGKMNSSTYLLFGWGGQVLMAWLTAIAFQRHEFKILKRPNIVYLVGIAGVSRGLSGYWFILAQIKSNNVALVTIVSSFRLVIIVLVGAWLLKERQRLKEKMLASAGAIAALSIIFWK